MKNAASTRLPRHVVHLSRRPSRSNDKGRSTHEFDAELRVIQVIVICILADTSLCSNCDTEHQHQPAHVIVVLVWSA